MRTFGTMRGQIWFAPDYDAADAEIEALFEESVEQLALLTGRARHR